MPNILVIDDEPHVRSLAVALLEDLGYDTLQAQSGRAGVQLLLQDPEAVAAVLLDLTMPGLSAGETWRLLNEIRPGLPVIALSGDLESSARDRFPPGALAGYIYKPEMDGTLEPALAQALTAEGGATGEPVKLLREPGPFKLSRLSEDEVETMRKDYLLNYRHELPRMAEMLAREDFAALRAVGHSLKGSAGCFSLAELTRLGMALETHAQAADKDACSQQLAAIKHQLSKEKVT